VGRLHVPARQPRRRRRHRRVPGGVRPLQPHDFARSGGGGDRRCGPPPPPPPPRDRGPT
jgi:hypothetical protein